MNDFVPQSPLTEPFIKLKKLSEFGFRKRKIIILTGPNKGKFTRLPRMFLKSWKNPSVLRTSPLIRGEAFVQVEIAGRLSKAGY